MSSLSLLTGLWGLPVAHVYPEFAAKFNIFQHTWGIFRTYSGLCRHMGDNERLVDSHMHINCENEAVKLV